MNDGRLVSPGEMEEERAANSVLRPRRLEDFVGQPAIREQVRILIEAARARTEPVDHVLLYGPPGLGKTTLAQIIATEMGVQARLTSGPALAIHFSSFQLYTSKQRCRCQRRDASHHLAREQLWTHLVL